jgi:hypothetical protein
MRTESPIREKIVISTDTTGELRTAFYHTDADSILGSQAAQTSWYWIFAGADEIGSLVAHEPNVIMPQKMTLDATIRGQSFVLSHVGKSPCAGSSCDDYSLAMERGEELVALCELRGDGSGGCSVKRGFTDEVVQDILTLFIYADVAARRMRGLGP